MKRNKSISKDLAQFSKHGLSSLKSDSLRGNITEMGLIFMSKHNFFTDDFEFSVLTFSTKHIFSVLPVENWVIDLAFFRVGVKVCMHFAGAVSIRPPEAHWSQLYLCLCICVFVYLCICVYAYLCILCILLAVYIRPPEARWSLHPHSVFKLSQGGEQAAGRERRNSGESCKEKTSDLLAEMQCWMSEDEN